MDINELTQDQLDALISEREQLMPFLKKFDGDDGAKIYSAIMDGKIDAAIADAALSGRLTVAQEKAIEKAAEGASANGIPADVLQREVEKAIAGLGVGKRLEEVVERLDDIGTINRINEFASSVGDFDAYRGEIEKWYDSHEGLEALDIQEVYAIVKGSKVLEQAAAAQAEAEKAAAATTGGSNSSGTGGSNESFLDEMKRVGNTNGFY
jgi:hypothetical protein